MTVTLTREAWKKFAPKCPAAYTAALFSHLDLLADAGIFENERRWCHFAATVYAETGGFTEIRESLRYTTTKALRTTWPSRFGHRSDAELKALLKNEVHLADVVYGCYSGRKPAEIGDVKPGEAFGYRGGGWFQTTFKPAVATYCRKLGVEPTPQSLDDPVLTLKFAVLEWTEGKCNTYADANEIRKVAKVINTGSATNNIEPVGMDHRKAAFARAWQLWGEEGEADVPAKDGVSLKQVVTVGGSTAVGGAVVVQQAAETVKTVKSIVPEIPPEVTESLANATAIKEATSTAVGLGKEAVSFASSMPWLFAIAIVLGALWWLIGRKQNA